MQRWLAILLGSLLLGSALVSVQAEPAHAGTTAYKCVNAGCKYGKVRAAYTSLIHDRADNRGATASGTCDPTNDVTRWRVERLRIYEGTTQRYSTSSPFGWHTNCALATYYWGTNVVREDIPDSMYTKTHWERDASCSGCDFDQWVNTYSY